MTTLLIVDDEIMIREVIKEYGNSYGYKVLEASDGLQAIEIIKKNDVDCVILDVMMPHLDGFSTCKHIKEHSDVPIIMLSARVAEDDKLYGFELGIDDYVSKPFSPKELMARIKVVIERRTNKVKDVINIEGISIDKLAHVVKVDDEIVHLTNKEFDLLVFLIENENKAITREKLLENIWGYDYISMDRTVDTHIKMLRKNLGKYGSKIVTVRGVGYKFEEK
ncbi:MAG TPA: response regulator transcription factor [Erysipelotrichaceae bacterium]|jgi:DNA-binding response OmpR family regulator|nr:response regulator transcription factor [Erysipelotrichia bacterium]HPX32742.1 response regulator transcription factor [Erysipelotrichaceae bacterium]HQA85306.1 response regulator transcription factor [Erysipelotrichaceae bacterium]